MITTENTENDTKCHPDSEQSEEEGSDEILRYVQNDAMRQIGATK